MHLKLCTTSVGLVEGSTVGVCEVGALVGVTVCCCDEDAEGEIEEGACEGICGKYSLIYTNCDLCNKPQTGPVTHEITYCGGRDTDRLRSR